MEGGREDEQCEIWGQKKEGLELECDVWKDESNCHIVSCGDG